MNDNASALCRALIDLCAADASIGDYSEAAAAGSARWSSRVHWATDPPRPRRYACSAH
ncbi:hypothetical protein NKH18_24720 [Streptomyces sp. M10(2022)]